MCAWSRTQEFIARLKDEALLLDLIGKAQQYYQTIKKISFESKIALLRMELEYYRYHGELDVLSDAGESASRGVGFDGSVVSTLAMFLYKHGDQRCERSHPAIALCAHSRRVWWSGHAHERCCATCTSWRSTTVSRTRAICC